MLFRGRTSEEVIVRHRRICLRRVTERVENRKSKIVNQMPLALLGDFHGCRDLGDARLGAAAHDRGDVLPLDTAIPANDDGLILVAWIAVRLSNGFKGEMPPSALFWRERVVFVSLFSSKVL